MKTRSLFVFVLVFVLVSMLATPVLALSAGQGVEPIQPTEAQVILIGIVASAVLYVLRLIAASTQWSPNKAQVSIALYVISFCMAIWFSGAVLPTFPLFVDAPTFVSALLNYIGSLLALASPIAGFAYLIYNVLLKRVFDAAAAQVIKG